MSVRGRRSAFLLQLFELHAYLQSSLPVAFCLTHFHTHTYTHKLTHTYTLGCQSEQQSISLLPRRDYACLCASAHFTAAEVFVDLYIRPLEQHSIPKESTHRWETHTHTYTDMTTCMCTGTLDMPGHPLCSSKKQKWHQILDMVGLKNEQ